MSKPRDKFDTYAEIAGGVSGLPERAWPGLAEIFRQIAKDEREAIDAACRTLMIQAADDQSTVRAVVSALDKVRVVIRDRAKQ